MTCILIFHSSFAVGKIEVSLKPKWKLHSGTSKDEIERALQCSSYPVGTLLCIHLLDFLLIVFHLCYNHTIKGFCKAAKWRGKTRNPEF